MGWPAAAGSAAGAAYRLPPVGPGLGIAVRVDPGEVRHDQRGAACEAAGLVCGGNASTAIAIVDKIVYTAC